MWQTLIEMGLKGNNFCVIFALCCAGSVLRRVGDWQKQDLRLDVALSQHSMLLECQRPQSRSFLKSRPHHWSRQGGRRSVATRYISKGLCKPTSRLHLSIQRTKRYGCFGIATLEAVRPCQCGVRPSRQRQEIRRRPFDQTGRRIRRKETNGKTS